MSLKTNANNKVSVSNPVEVVTDKVEIESVTINFKLRKAFAYISFGIEQDGEFKPMKNELWVLQNDFYDTNLDGSDMSEMFRQNSAGIVQNIQNTEGVKDALIASNSLVLSNGTWMDFIGQIQN